MESEQTNKAVRLKPGNCGAVFEVVFGAASQMRIVRRMIEDVGFLDEPIPLPNVQCDVLTIILEFCDKHRDEKEYEETGMKSLEIDDWSKSFIQRHLKKLFSIVLAADYLEIGFLLDLCCQFIVNSISGKTPKEARDFLGIENDWDAAEYEQILRENGWIE
ncbi:SCF complex subunit Skp1 [Schizopora paradoxa]|uniref:E3 ubiquitin ligase complex SCF subunit n=1 Tax=Schizopora paradoxa TaxID=27342 RepID=A0A0H2R3K5_9AGAM|nr:SCF complex subunit Skp1 [Schizopora paradoxa]